MDMTSCGQQLETVANFQLAITSITLAVSWKGSYFFVKTIKRDAVKYYFADFIAKGGRDPPPPIPLRFFGQNDFQ